MAVLCAPDGSELRLLMTDEEAFWIDRSRHPAYASRIAPLLEAFALTVIRLEFGDAGSGTLTCTAISCLTDESERRYVPSLLALLSLSTTPVPAYVESAMLDAPGHYDEIGNAFTDFLSDLTADDFVWFNSGRPH